MKSPKSVIVLSILVAVLAVAQAGLGLFWQDGGSPFSFTTLRGQVVQINGQGIYHYDTFFKAPILRGTDAITLFLCVPLLIAAIVLAGKGSLRGKVLLTTVLAFLLYDSASVALGAAYNNLFLLYVAFFSASLFAFILAYRSVDVQDLAARVSGSVSHRGIAALMFLSGVALLFAWLGDIIGSLVTGGTPGIASYTTEVTYVFDLGVITPVAILTGVLILRRSPSSYLLAAIMLVVLAIVGVVLVAQTVAQMMAGIVLTPGEFIGKDVSFILLALISIWLTVPLFRGMGAAKRLGTRA